MTEKLSIIGSTGSIGVQSLQVARSRGFEITALAAGKNIDLLEKQIREFRPKIAAVFDETAARELKIRIADTDTKVLAGEEGVCECAAKTTCDTVLNAAVGIAGLRPTITAIDAGKTLALANKESLVTGGELVMKKIAQKKTQILPVDSEHSAIFQCLQGVPKGAKIKKILLTASGGPFFGKTKAELENVTASDALKHPNWDMGAKITIDSATMMNKGLEVIEAVHLFDVSADLIEVVVHRESIIHSGVEFADGALITQLGIPDMKLPIQYALTYPERFECDERTLSLSDLGKLTFYKPDYDTFPCLSAALFAINRGGLCPSALNGANEEAVALFLNGKIGFNDIGTLTRAAAENESGGITCVEDIYNADKRAREFVRANVN